MKRFLVVMLLLAGIPKFAMAQESTEVAMGARLGLSNVSGLFALELQGANIMGSVGWMPAFGDGAESIFRPLRIALALRAKVKKIGHSPVLSISFMTRYAGYNYGTGVKAFPFLSASVGYRILIGDKADLIIGGGLGLNVGLDELGKVAGLKRLWPAIDLTVGILP